MSKKVKFALVILVCLKRYSKPFPVLLCATVIQGAVITYSPFNIKHLQKKCTLLLIIENPMNTINSAVCCHVAFMDTTKRQSQHNLNFT